MIERMARRVTSPVLVGRSQLVEQLDAAVRASVAGQPRHAVIGGEAGVGKTRLLAEMRQPAEVAGARVLQGGCVSMGAEGLPFAPYTEIIRTLVAEDGAVVVAAAAGRAVSDLARIVPALAADDAAPDQELWAQTRLYEALLDLFRHLAQRQPLVLQLEDLHWADAGTLAATSYLLRAIRDEPITVVATFRADEVTRKHPIRAWLAEVGRDANVERIELEPLDGSDVASLISHILGEELQDREVQEIQRRSDGNPFFVEELLCCRTAYGGTLPASLRDVLLSRIDALPDAAQHLLGAAAVGGREVEHHMLVAVAGAADGAADLRVLVDSGLLLPTQALDGDDAYAFRHALLREVVYDEMLPTERRRLHHSWGEYLAEHRARGDKAAYLVQLAHHWREGRDARALAASIAAGDAAMESFSYEVAASEYDAALLLWDEGSEATSGIDHVEMLERTARAAYMSMRNRRAVAACREALDELGSGDASRRTMLQILLGRVLWVMGDWGTSTGAYEEALRIAPIGTPIVRARALAGLGQVYMLHARLDEARPLLEEAIGLARENGVRDLEGHGLNSLGVVLAGLGETSTANESIETALGIALELGIPDDIGRAYVNRAEIESWSGFPDRAVETSLEGVRVCTEWGVSSSYGAYIGHGGVSFAFEIGDWDQAASFMAETDRLGSNTEGNEVYRASYLMEYLACTDHPAFQPTWRRTQQLTVGRPTSDNYGLLIQGGIEHAAFAGRHDEAVRIAWDGIERIGESESPLRLAELARVVAWPLAEIGRAAHLAGDEAAKAEVDQGMDRLLDMATTWQRSSMDPTDRLARLFELDVAQIGAERARIEGADTARVWGSLASAWADFGRPFRSAMARWREAAAAEADGDRDAAAVALREAHRVASELGAKPLLVHLETMARRLRVRLGSGPATSPSPDRAYGLTPREMEVLNEVAAGHTNREIAQDLFISESTAGVHVSNILGKLGVSTRTEAARVALDQGLTN